jgi:hypothetical protein
MTYTLSKNEVGKIVRIDNSSVILIPANVFSLGDVLVVFNNSDEFRTIQSLVPETYVSGKPKTRTVIEFPPRAAASIMFVDDKIAVILGEVS